MSAPKPEFHLNNYNLPDFNELHKVNLKDFKEYYSKGFEIIKELHRGGMEGSSVVNLITGYTDQMIKRLFTLSENEYLSNYPKSDVTVALVALGGYGRGELNPYSDIDLLFFHSWKINQYVEFITERMLYTLWDLGLQVGSSTRNISETIKLANLDTSIKTSLFDHRYICGNIYLYNEFENQLNKNLLHSNQNRFISDKLKEKELRHQKYGSSVYILEPNIKEGNGGLRDLHSLLWIAKAKFKVQKLKELKLVGAISDSEIKHFEDILNFLFTVRNELHYLSKRKNDQIVFEYQEEIAKNLGYISTREDKAVESFIKDFYLKAKEMEELTDILIERWVSAHSASKNIMGFLTKRDIGNGFRIFNGMLAINDPDLFKKNPPLLMKAFELSQRHGVELHHFTREKIKEIIPFIDGNFRREKEVNSSFFNILKAPKGVYSTLKLMNDIKFLGRFIPEFGKLFCKVQHDFYHIYTVDQHSLFAVKELRLLRRGEYKEELPLLTQLAKKVKKFEILLLAALFHDIGKGYGSGHSERGERIASSISKRMKLSEEDTALLKFLVRHHLQMSNIAQRRDLHDDLLIINFAKLIKDEETLELLYLLTFADLKAVGPEVWNNWKKMLLEELFVKTVPILRKRTFKREKIEDRVGKLMHEILPLIKGTEITEPDVKEHLTKVPLRYFFANDAKNVIKHIRAIKGFDRREFILNFEQNLKNHYTEITFVSNDTHGLFSMLTGVMAANNVNILGAQINTRTDGIIIDILQVIHNVTKGFINEEAKTDTIRNDLKLVLEGTVPIETLISKKGRLAISDKKMFKKYPTKVELDNNVSETHTVIDIYTHDRLGLLYTITSTISKLGLEIDVAKISTKVDQVADVFYVKDSSGRKITDEAYLDKIRNTLISRLSGSEEALQ